MSLHLFRRGASGKDPNLKISLLQVVNPSFSLSNETDQVTTYCHATHRTSLSPCSSQDEYTSHAFILPFVNQVYIFHLVSQQNVRSLPLIRCTFPQRIQTPSR